MALFLGFSLKEIVNKNQFCKIDKNDLILIWSKWNTEESSNKPKNEDTCCFACFAIFFNGIDEAKEDEAMRCLRKGEVKIMAIGEYFDGLQEYMFRNI